MAQIYYNLIVKGLKTIDDVPARWREAVAAMLGTEEAQGDATA